MLPLGIELTESNVLATELKTQFPDAVFWGRICTTQADVHLTVIQYAKATVLLVLQNCIYVYFPFLDKRSQTLYKLIFWDFPCLQGTEFDTLDNQEEI